uniref:Cilia- and flagella-associated protein 36 n=1 Tax=Strongyloides papillosus TaxID=174720 RepID=A0A0N5BC81_STREA
MFNRAKEKEAEKAKSITVSREIVCKFLLFLNSSYWKIPIDTFIEQQSILFDNRNVEENTLIQIHKEYITMVDVLIEAFCDDLNISLRELVSSLDAINKTVPIALEEEISLEPVIAAQDFDVFVSMMKRKNLEIKLQTIHILEIMAGSLPAILKLDEDFENEVKNIFTNTSETERYILISIMQKSREEFEKEQELRTEFEKQIEAAIKASLENQYKAVENENNFKIEDQEIVKTLSIQEKKNNNKEGNGKVKSRSNSVTPKRAGSEKRRKEVGEAKTPATPKTSPIDCEPKIDLKPGDDRYMFRNLLKTPNGVDEAKIKEREEYLKEQRDKLIQKKKKEREEKLKKIEKESPDRPKTASAAKRAMAGNMKNTSTSREVLEARKAIYDKLKTEIINQ